MRMKNWMILLACIGALLALKFLFFPAPSREQAPMKQNKGGPTNVTAYVVLPEKLSNEVYVSGTVMANEEVQLQSEISGKIVKLDFQEGTKVAKGDLLVKINDTDLQAQFSKLKLQHKLAEEKMKRLEQLLSIKGISQEEFDVSKNQFEVIRADLDFASAQIARTEIRAPFNGVIGLRYVSEGAYVNPATLIAAIQQIDPVKLDFFVSERYASMVKKGDKLMFSVEGSDKKRTAEVFAVEPKIDMATRSLHVRAICRNPHGDIFPGAFARIELALGQVDSALLVPNESIIPELKGQKVYRLRNGKAEAAKVTTGLRTDTRIQITNGLSAGDTVITTGLMQLKPGARVKVIEFKKSGV